jgi:hypothetical protein
MFAPSAAPSFLQKLRRSTRLAAWVLLVFGLKLGMSFACIEHDLADLGLPSGEHSELVATSSPGDGEGPTGSASHGMCAHAASHQAANLVAAGAATFPKAHVGLEAAEPAGQLLRRHQDSLRPPIV